jgi:hypothetical protein
MATIIKSLSHQVYECVEKAKREEISVSVSYLLFFRDWKVKDETCYDT